MVMINSYHVRRFSAVNYNRSWQMQHATNDNQQFKFKIMETIYFQPPDIKPMYCEAGMISETDPEYIWYLNEPCKILINEVKIIPKEQVTYDKKKRLYYVNKSHE